MDTVRCDCETAWCEEEGHHPAGGCPNTATAESTFYGIVVRYCAGCMTRATHHGLPGPKAADEVNPYGVRRLLDLFCGAGGASMGYHLAGFEVVGVDIRPQPNYPFEFHQADALDFPLDGFDVIHASPPCQAWSTMRHHDDHPRLIEPTRARLRGRPHVIENIPSAPLRRDVMLCGSMFGLRVIRHRVFESSIPLTALPHRPHHPDFITVTGHFGGHPTPRRAGGLHRTPANLADASDAMGAAWMTGPELVESIPPAYTEWIGRQL